MLAVQVFINVQLENMLAAGTLITLVCKASIRGWHVVNHLCSQAPCESGLLQSLGC